MRRKNLGLKVAALAVTGTIAVSPMTVRAEEGTASTAVSAPASAAAGATSSTGTTAAGGAASTPAASTTAATTGAASASAASTTTPAADTTATTGMTTAAPAAVSSDVITNTDGSISLRESPAASGTTAPNNVKDEVTDDKQETDIHFSGEFKKSWISIPAGNSINATIKPEDAKEGKTLAELPGGFNSVSAFSDIKAEDMIMKGD